MSANKKTTVQINRREYERLRQLERSELFPPEAKNNALVSSVETALLTQVQEMARRQNEYQDIITGMGREFQELETQASSAFVLQQQQFINELNSLERGVSINTEQLLHQQAQVFERALRQAENEFQEQAVFFYDYTQQVKNETDRKSNLVEELMDEVEEIWSWFLETYRWKQFLPKGILDIEDNLELISRNYDLGNFENCILVSQKTLKAIEHARMEIERKETEWIMLLGIVKEHAFRLFHIAKDNRTVMPVDVHGNVLQDRPEINVNYWSDGELKVFTDTIRAILGQLQDYPESMSSKGLKEWLKTRLPELEENLLDIVMKARENVLDSQLRADIAEVIIESMRRQGFEITHIEDHNNEIRQPMNVLMQNLVGDEVYINLTPESEGIGKNQITINTAETESMSMYELNQRRNEIAESLTSYGVDLEINHEKIAEPKNNSASQVITRRTGEAEVKSKLPKNRHVSTP